MQLFSRNKAILALSLGALALGACGDDVTVPVAPAAPVVMTITPPSANMNIGEALNFAVQISGGSTTAAPTLQSCAVTPATVATATVAGSACRVTAVAAGNATVTATASTGQLAAASIAVSAPAPALTSLAVSPSAAQLAVGGSVTLVSTVQPAGRTTTFTYTTSSATIASVTAAGVVTAVAPGTATITVVATGSAAGFTTTEIRQAVTITVSDRAPGLTSLTVQPSSITMSLGSTQPLTAAVQGPRAAAVTYTYGSSAPTIANSSATGVVTAIAPGTAVITVTASSTESGAFAATAITALVPVTVTPNAQVIINSLTKNGATIDITNVRDQFEVNLSLQPNGQNVSSVQAWVCAPDQTVAQCAAATNGVPAAQQSFGGAGGQAGQVQLYINSAEFTTPNFTTGDDANTLYKNGLRTIVATITTAPAAAAPVASNNISQVNFNNTDGWTIDWAQPTNRANDAQGNTWYGGPTTVDPLVQGTTSGRSTFTVVPVVYNPGRTVRQVTLAIGGLTCGRNTADQADETFEGITLYARPYRASFGVQTRDTLAGAFNCGASSAYNFGSVSNLDGVTPQVSSAIDNNNAAYTSALATGNAPAQSIYRSFVVDGITANDASRYRQSLAFRRNTIYIPMDYQSPAVQGYDVRGGGSVSNLAITNWIDSAWVNQPYLLAGGFARVDTAVALTQGGNRNLRAGDPLRLNVSENGVGLLGSASTTSSRNTRFRVCNTPAQLPIQTDTTPVFCGSTANFAPLPLGTNALTQLTEGTITQTAAQAGIVETPITGDLTNSAYTIQVVETDRLGNRGTSNPYAFTRRLPNNGTTVVAFTPASNEPFVTNNRASAQAFGADYTAPELLTIPNPQLTDDPFNPSVSGVRSGIDSIFSSIAGQHTYAASTTTTVGANDVNINGTNALFAVRARDSRSGWFNCTANVSCGATTAEVNMGQFQIERRTPQLNPIASNDALIQNIVQNSIVQTDGTVLAGDANATFGRFATVMNATQLGVGGDPSVRQFTINIWGAVNRARATLQPQPANTRGGYYVFTGTLQDRAGNTLAVPTRRVALDGAQPTLNNLVLPAVFTGGQRTPVIIQASDDAEIMGADMTLGIAGGAAPINIRFNRVTTLAATITTGLFQNPFAALTSGKLATPTGTGQFFNGPANAGVPFPVPFIQDLQVATGGNVPGLAGAPNKPTTLATTVYDLRAMMTLTGYAAPTTPTSLTPQFALTAVGSTRTENIAPNQVTQGALIKNWRADIAGPPFNQGADIDTWQLVTSTSTSAEWRARSISSTASVPFTSVAVVTRRLTTAPITYEANYEYRGDAVFAGVVNEGGQRFFRYTWTAGGAVAQGANSSVFAFAAGDSIRAIGQDANGNALMTDASVPGTVATTAVITGISVFATHLSDGVAALPASLTNPVIADFNIWKTRNNSTTLTTVIQETPASIAGDASVFIGRAAANATARVWLTLTQPLGAPLATNVNTVIVCTSNLPADIVPVGVASGTGVLGGWATPVGTTVSATSSRPYCDVRGGAAASNTASLTVTATMAGSGPFAGSGTANANLNDPTPSNRTVLTSFSTTLSTEAPAVTTPNYGAVGGASTATVLTNFVTTIPVAAPTFAGIFNPTNTAMIYTAFFGGGNNSQRYAGISFSTSTNPLTGAGTVTVSCTTSGTGTQWAIQNNAGVVQANAGLNPATTFPVIIQARARSAIGYSNPITYAAVNVGCQ